MQLKSTCPVCGQPCQTGAARCRRCWGAPASLEVRFRRSFIKSPSCWTWLGRPNSQGYGKIGRGKADGGGLIYAHRYALEQARGAPLPPGFEALHTCDTPSCVRNDDVGTYEVNGVLFPRWGHLWMGTNADNHADMAAKGRGRKAAEKAITVRVFKIPPADIAAIRALTAVGELTHRQIAQRFRINRGTVSKIATGKIRAAV